jgi:hypothetical protein
VDSAWHQSFSGAATAARAVVEHHDKLDPDGCLVRFSSQPAAREKRARLVSARMKMAGVVALTYAMSLRRAPFTLDYGRLMGVRYRRYSRSSAIAETGALGQTRTRWLDRSNDPQPPSVPGTRTSLRPFSLESNKRLVSQTEVARRRCCATRPKLSTCDLDFRTRPYARQQDVC